MKETITRKDGIVYERKRKEYVYGHRFMIRLTEESYQKFSEIAQKKNVKPAILIRNLIDEYIKEENK